MIATLLFMLPSNICGFQEDKNSNIETENLPDIDVSDELDNEHNVETNGPAVMIVARREAGVLTDDYNFYPLCGDKPMDSSYTCYCGYRTLSGIADLSDGDYYCCVPPSAVDGQDQCKYTGPGQYGDTRRSDVRCENGELRHKTEPCHQNCWNSYRKSEKLWKTATLYCHEEDYCLPLDQMCSGICSDESEMCDPRNLRCIGKGHQDLGYTNKSLDTKLGKDHGYCLKINNDQVYDSISRSDEQKVLGTNQPTVDYTGLVKCNNKYGNGIQCSDGCKWIRDWCTGRGDVCKTPAGAFVSVDTPALCRNATYWRINNFSCDLYDSSWSGRVVAAGAKCSSDYQHCTFPWYRWYSAGITDYSINPSCLDKSDQVFPINSTCRQHNQQFLKTYRTLWCSGNNDKYTGAYCDYNGKYLDDWFTSEQEDEKIRDPHGCERSCSIAGPDCVACEHEDFFHCPSTGFCINKENVCDGHPHPSCGGDDEGIYHCLEIYFKKRIVKRYATLICPSVIYPGNNNV